MYLNNLIVYSNELETEIRNIPFKIGLNLIVDSGEDQKTGNDLGKTTFLRAIDFCLGSDIKELYFDRDEKRENEEIKDFLIRNKISFELNIGKKFGTTDYTLKRWFTGEMDKKNTNNPVIQQTIDNGKPIGIRRYTKTLNQIFFNIDEKPTFRNLIPKFVREDKESMGSLLRFLSNSYTSNEEFNSIHLLLFGFSDSVSFTEKASLTALIKSDENKQKVYVSDYGDKNKLEAEIGIKKTDLLEISKKCDDVKKQISSISNLETDLDELNEIVVKINEISNEITKNEIFIKNVSKSIDRLSSEKVNVDIEAIKLLYKEINSYNEKLHKDFDEVVDFHNKMIDNKIQFSRNALSKKQSVLENLLRERKELLDTYEISKEDADNKLFEKLDKLDEERLNISNQLKIKESIFKKLEKLESDIDSNTTKLDETIKTISKAENIIKSNIAVFNNYFTNYTKRLYDDEYYIYLGKTISEPFNVNNKLNPGDGKKKAYITAFDLAYTAFINEVKIPSYPRFIAEDQLELIDTPQLEELFKISNEVNGQLIIPVLNSKISDMENLSNCEILTLSEESKFFKF